MGKGDRKTKRGKIYQGTHGKCRLKAKEKKKNNKKNAGSTKTAK